MSYEEFLIYSARLGELEDVKFCLDEKVDPNTVDASGNTALRKFIFFKQKYFMINNFNCYIKFYALYLFEKIMINMKCVCRYGMC